MTKKTSECEQLTLVGVGSSAGGLQALKDFFGHCVELKNFSYVVVQHTSPVYQTMLPKLLGGSSGLRVKDVAKFETIHELRKISSSHWAIIEHVKNNMSFILQ